MKYMDIYKEAIVNVRDSLKMDEMNEDDFRETMMYMTNLFDLYDMAFEIFPKRESMDIVKDVDGGVVTAHCGKCKTKVKFNYNFCPNCGTILTDDEYF